MGWNHWVALALVAAALWAFQIRWKRRAIIREMAGWTRIPGRVVSHDILASSSTDSEGRSESSYEPKLSYDYEVNGRPFTGTRLSLDGESFSSRQKAQKYLDERPIGSEVPVYVNPADPSDAILSTKAGGDWWVPVLFLGLAAAVALGLFGSS